MEVPSFQYETLSPLSFTTTTTTTAISAASGDSGDVPLQATASPKPYSVYRNEISVSSPQCATPLTASIDYFSLDFGTDTEESRRKDSVSACSPAAIPGPERTLETGWFRGNSRFKSPMIQLHKEILDFCDFLSPTPEEQEVRNTAIAGVFSVIKYIWPHCKVEVFGSFKTGLYLPSSDIDVVILGSAIRTPQLGLVALSRALSQRGIAQKIQVIGKARVPIIKFVEKKSGVSFDISFDVEGGPIAAQFIKDVVSKLPPLRPLCLILKVFLQQRELNEVYSGGLGSYALLAMLIAMLQSLHVSQASPEHNLGVLLVNFFEVYGRKLNTWDVGVSCNGEGTFFSKSERGFMNNGRPFLISIEDPQAPENDIGKSSFNYFQVKSAFGMAFSTLTNTKTIIRLGPNRSILGTIIRPDAVLLERKGGSNGQVTFDKLLPGAGEPLQPQMDNPLEILCNWQLNGDCEEDEEEEPLPRGNTVSSANGGGGASSSGKKRKKSSKKGKENGEVKKSKKVKLDENGSLKKKKRWRHNRPGN